MASASALAWSSLSCAWTILRASSSVIRSNNRNLSEFDALLLAIAASNALRKLLKLVGSLPLKTGKHKVLKSALTKLIGSEIFPFIVLLFSDVGIVGGNCWGEFEYWGCPFAVEDVTCNDWGRVEFWGCCSTVGRDCRGRCSTVGYDFWGRCSTVGYDFGLELYRRSEL